MRAAVPLLILGLAVLFGRDAPEAAARPEFARREQKACGYCHINPRGGGPRNQRGLTYARNEFKFPIRKGDLNSFKKDQHREAMIRARKMIDIDHTAAAVTQLRRLAKATKGGPREAVNAEIHDLEVKGTEILGQARRLLRGKDAEEGVELLVMLSLMYKGLEIHEDVMIDLKELRADKEFRALIKKEQREAKARLLYLDAQAQRVDGKADKSKKLLEKLVKSYGDTRVAKAARRDLRAAAEKAG